MAHLSENSSRLKKIVENCKYPIDLKNLDTSFPDVWLVFLPLNLDETTAVDFNNEIVEFSKKLNENSLLIILANHYYAPLFYLKLHEILKYQLWISVKLEHPHTSQFDIKNQHVAVLVLSKYKKSLSHTKTRIQYTYCPFCERTTKDYGGKKHLYHEYGTLMSDVWRDISYNPIESPSKIIERIQDLFGIKPYSSLRIIDLRNSNLELIKAGINEPKVDYTFFDSRINKNFKESELINSDCVDALKNIPSNSIDYCFADPPYNIEKKYDSWNDSLAINDYFKWCDEWLSELSRVLKPGRICSVLNIPIWAIRHFSYLQKIMHFNNWIVWEGLSLPVRMIMPSHYTILNFSKGEARPVPGVVRKENSVLEIESLFTTKENFCSRSSCIKTRQKAKIIDKEPITNLWWDIHRLKHNSRRVDHPTQLPPKLMMRLISLYSNENEIVLDPFNGTGTTSLSAEILNRKFIGIELSEYYHKIASKRHHELRNGIDPFRKNGETPKAKNSRVQRLKPQKYLVTKKELQLEIKRISQELGKIPNRSDVKENSKYPLEFFDNYFINWGEVCAAARTTGMTEYRKSTLRAKNKVEQLNIFDSSDNKNVP